MSSITEQVGRVVGGRYRLSAPVGAGASAQVFAAVDTRLHRRVAVKVLHPMLAEDSAFLRRFRAEARLAASLDHPHVMRVFDWGEEPGGPYLVLEFLGGGNLRALLDTGVHLDHSQVAHIGAQAASGLAYAHRRGIVHRDIKPGNLLFDEEGNLRIADFGVARALAEAALTEPLGAIFGTARYASPEQAEGRALDDRTDVYSLALVLYEALTGRVPFTRDTISATLISRVGATLPPAKELGPLAPVLAQSAISEPLARLDSNALSLDLEMLCRELPAPMPLPLEATRLDGDPTFVARLDPTDLDPRLKPEPPSPREASRGVDQAAGRGAGLPERVGTAGAVAEAPAATPAEAEVVPPVDAEIGAGAQVEVPGPGRAEGTNAAAVPASAGVPPAGEQPGRRGRHRLGVALVLLVVVLVLGGAGTAAVMRFVVYGHKVPHLVSLDLSTARRDARMAGLRLAISERRFDLGVRSGYVISQSLRPGRLERSGTPISIVVSKGPAPVPVPDLSSDTLREAEAALAKGHLGYSKPTSSYSETVPSGKLVSWAPRSGLQRRGTAVHLVVSLGPHPRIVAAVGHGSYAGAASLLEKEQLVPRAAYESSTSFPAGEVIATSPSSGTTVKRGTPVTVYVSTGPPMTTVPDVTAGEPVGEAIAALRRQGLVAEVYGPGNRVFTMSHPPGERLPVSSVVYVYTF